MTLAALKKMSDDRLFTYFSNNARYEKNAPKLKYSIRLGSRAIFSDDTADLRQKFFDAVRGEQVQDVGVKAQETTK